MPNPSYDKNSIENTQTHAHQERGIRFKNKTVFTLKTMNPIHPGGGMEWVPENEHVRLPDEVN